MSVRSSVLALRLLPAAPSPISTAWAPRHSLSCATASPRNTAPGSSRAGFCATWRKRAIASITASRRKSARPRDPHRFHCRRSFSSDPMARDQVDLTPIERRDELVDWIAQGIKPKSQFRIGTEHEKFAFTLEGHQPVPYEGGRGIRALLEGMQHLLGWQPIMEEANVIGLFDVTGGGAISLEPGGQFELSGAQVETVHQTSSELMAHLAQVREVARPLGIGFLGIGMTPSWSRAAMPKMPKGRYRIMTAYMPKIGTRGLDMMYRTCTVQTNLDFASEADMVKKLRVSIALQPLATALFANSPFTEGKPNGFLSYRSEIWRDTDNARAGMLPWAVEPGMGFERWVDYALDVPMYFVKHGDEYVDASGQSFRDLLAGKLPAMPGARATISDWANHLSTPFPEVRLKRYLEMRGADSGSLPNLLALPALWVGILYDDSSLDAAWEIAKEWSVEQRQKLRDEVPKTGLAATVHGRTVFEIATDLLKLARAGLERRKHRDVSGQDETRYLEVLEDLLARGTTPAQELLKKFSGPWAGSVDPIYTEEAY